MAFLSLQKVLKRAQLEIEETCCACSGLDLETIKKDLNCIAAMPSSKDRSAVKYWTHEQPIYIQLKHTP